MGGGCRRHAQHRHYSSRSCLSNSVLFHLTSQVVAIHLVSGQICTSGKPLDRLGEATAKTFQSAEGRLPAKQVTRLGVVRPEALDLALVRAQALRVGQDLDVCFHDLGDGAGGVADADLEVAPQINHLTDTGIGLERFDEAVDGVGNEVEIAGRMHGAELDAALAAGDLRDDGRDHGTGGLARSVGVEGSQRDDRGAEGQIKGLGDLIRADLAGRVGRLALQGMRLGNGHEAGGAVDLAGGGVNNLADAQLTRGLDDVERALDVGVDVSVRRMIGVGDRD